MSVLAPCKCVIRRDDGRKEVVEGLAVAFPEVRQIAWTITSQIDHWGHETGRWTITEWSTGACLPLSGKTPEEAQAKAAAYFKKCPLSEILVSIARAQEKARYIDSGLSPWEIKLTVERERQRERRRAIREKRRAAA